MSSPSKATAGPKADEIDFLAEGASKLIAWFGSLLDAVDELVAGEEKRRFIEKLSALNKDLYDLEQDKRFLLELLKRKTINDFQINRAATDLQSSTRKVQEGVREVGLSLREQFRAGGVSVEGQLGDALNQRKQWLGDMRQNIGRDDFDPTKYIEKGENAVTALKAANLALIKLIQQLEVKSE